MKGFKETQQAYDNKEHPSFYNDNDDIEFGNFSFGNTKLEQFVEANKTDLDNWLLIEGTEIEELEKHGCLYFFIESSADEAELNKEYLTPSECEELEETLYKNLNEAIQEMNP